MDLKVLSLYQKDTDLANLEALGSVPLGSLLESGIFLTLKERSKLS
jgi:hypothetical protein